VCTSRRQPRPSAWASSGSREAARGIMPRLAPMTKNPHPASEIAVALRPQSADDVLADVVDVTLAVASTILPACVAAVAW